MKNRLVGADMVQLRGAIASGSVCRADASHACHSKEQGLEAGFTDEDSVGDGDRPGLPRCVVRYAVRVSPTNAYWYVRGNEPKGIRT